MENQRVCRSKKKKSIQFVNNTDTGKGNKIILLETLNTKKVLTKTPDNPLAEACHP
jgi:hypothetical protein